jgi:hypothetical protein
MPLNSETQKQIEEFVRQKPRNIQEIANHLEKSWKTADRYVKEIVEKEPTVEIRKFREGSRGALKVVYWSGRTQKFSSSFKDKLFSQLEAGSGKAFSPFDIYQCANKEEREAFVEKQEPEDHSFKHDVISEMKKAEKEVLIFSRNLSWATMSQKDRDFTELFKELGEKGVDIRFIGRVDVGSMENAEELLSLNQEIGRNAVNVRHSNHSVRGFIVDEKIAQLSEVRELEEEYVRKRDPELTTYLFYYIEDKDWVEWLKKCFWKLNNTSLDGEERIKDLKTIKNISEM